MKLMFIKSYKVKICPFLLEFKYLVLCLYFVGVLVAFRGCCDNLFIYFYTSTPFGWLRRIRFARSRGILIHKIQLNDTSQVTSYTQRILLKEPSLKEPSLKEPTFLCHLNNISQVFFLREWCGSAQSVEGVKGPRKIIQVKNEH